MSSPAYPAVEIKESSVREALALGNVFDAVAAALSEHPIQSKDIEYKNAVADIVFTAFDAVKSADIQSTVNSMDLEQATAAMRYVYRAMKEKRACASMLKWHSALVKHAGQGCIVRAISTRRSV